jgi:shikimate dehydrogenase
MKKLFTIFGNPVSHSRSPLMHNHLFKTLNVYACYTRTHLEDGYLLKDTFFDQHFWGANVTVPHKEDAFKQCDEVRGVAKAIKAVNTLVLEDGKMIGYNTDGDGFFKAVESMGTFNNVLILGAGGTAKALVETLLFYKKEVTVVNRSEKRLQSFTKVKTATWDEFEVASYDLIVNTTSAGLEDGALPMPKEQLEPLLQKCQFVFDVVYGKETPFLALAKELELPFKDGSDMLLYQGVLANQLFLNKQFDFETTLKPMQKSFQF